MHDVENAYDDKGKTAVHTTMGIDEYTEITPNWCNRWSKPDWRKMGQQCPKTGTKLRQGINCKMFPCCGFKNKVEAPYVIKALATGMKGAAGPSS